MFTTWSMYNQPDPDQPIAWPTINTRTILGISVAIIGNVLISLALNTQKLAHKRVETANLQKLREGELQTTNGTGYAHVNGNRPQPNRAPVDLDEEERIPEEDPSNDVFGATAVELPERPSALETEPLLGGPPSSHYNAGSRPQPVGGRRGHLPHRERRTSVREGALLPTDIANDANLLSDIAEARHPKFTRKQRRNALGGDNGKEIDYLKSKLWWLGFVLMNVGELGNFISYGFAPASVVAPLGTFALIANCLFAPLMLGERFRNRDLVAIIIAIVGAVTVVLSSNPSDVRLTPKALIHAISQRAFIVYSCIYAIGAAILLILSEGRLGEEHVFVDVGLCALFGGFTVLSTKGVSSLLTLEWIEMFTEWITYPTILVLLLTGIGQIKYLNRALMRFDSKVVIPIQFVFFNLSAIVGSAILYGDFRKATFHQFVTFVYGCLATFVGVFIIAWGGNQNNLVESDAEDRSESITDDTRFGSIGRRKRSSHATPARGKAVLNRRHSALSIGLSPAQHLLLVHSPPRDEIELRDEEFDPEGESELVPESWSRIRAILWKGGDAPAGSGQGGRKTRDSSLVGRQHGRASPAM